MIAFTLDDHPATPFLHHTWKPSRLGSFVLALLVSLFAGPAALAREYLLEPKLHHLRVTGPREWSEFPEQPDGASLSLRFQSEKNSGTWTLRWRQQDVRQTWKVLLNGKEAGRLTVDENDMVCYLPLRPGALVTGENSLVIEQVGRTPDDIRVGEIALDDRSMSQVLSEATVNITVLETHPHTKPAALPCRLTIVNAQGALMTVGAASGKHLAVRAGVIYSGTGQADFGLPAGKYTIYAGRGFEYGVDAVSLTLKPGDHVHKALSLRREVPTEGYVSSDTHVHTLTFSGHGDASIDERMLTIAGEGLELPIATDHNRQIDYHPAATKGGVRRYFTPIVGNEVTTPVGHFNIFPVPANDQIPDFKLKNWKKLSASIEQQTAAKVIVLNHPRDRHSGFRPFGPERQNAVTGTNLEGWELKANAMEVVNSGAQQSDVMQLYRDWFALLNRGMFLTPVGASDSHDVARYLVGQARTYVRCKDDDPGSIDVEEAVASFVSGRVLVSCGLLVNMTVNGKYGPGDLVPAGSEVRMAVQVLGPSWVSADKVELFANGRKIHEARPTNIQTGGVKWSGEWSLPWPGHDLHLVAVASGPGVQEPYWPIAKPYQPTSAQVISRVIGSTGAVWIDGDRDGQRTSAHAYAQRLVKAASSDMAKLVKALADHDEAVSSHAAELLQTNGASLQEAAVVAALRDASPHVQRGFQRFAEAWRESQIAKIQK